MFKVDIDLEKPSSCFVISSVIVMSTTSKNTNFDFLDEPLVEVIVPFQGLIGLQFYHQI